MRKIRKKEGSAVYQILRALGISTLIGASLCAVLLLLMAWVITSSGFLPVSFVTILILAILALSSFVAGISSAKLTGKRGLWMGGATGAFLFVILLLSALLFSSDINMADWGTRFPVVFFAGALGGYIGITKFGNGR